MQISDFIRSYFRFYFDFEARKVISLSQKPPIQTNRVRVMLESVCQLTYRPTGRCTTYALTAACKTEQVGGERNTLWMKPNADCIFICSDDEQVAIHKSWHKNDPGVMRYPESLGPQPERQIFQAEENFDEMSLELVTTEATAITDFESAERAILDIKPIVSRIEYSDGQFDVRIDQPVKTINIAERDRLHQTDTGPILLPDLCEKRLAENELEIGVFDLAYSAWHASDWVEFVIRKPVQLADGLSVNHYSQTRHIEPSKNTLFVINQ